MGTFCLTRGKVSLRPKRLKIITTNQETVTLLEFPFIKRRTEVQTMDYDLYCRLTQRRQHLTTSFTDGHNKAHWIREIKKNTIISTDHLTPKIPLHLITKDCGLYHKPYSQDVKTFPEDPFWGFYWPGGQAVSRYIEENAEEVRGKVVLDIGSGCGASAIAAVKAGARKVIANDIDEGE